MGKKYSLKKNNKEAKIEPDGKETVGNEENIRLEKALKKADELHKLDENNPMERAAKYREIVKNPVKPGFMEVKCTEEKDDEGNVFIVSESKQPDGSTKKIKHSPFFTVDLANAIMANVAACPANVGPMLLDEGMKLVDLKKTAFKPEKRRDDNKMMVVLFICLITISVGAGAYLIWSMFG